MSLLSLQGVSVRRGREEVVHDVDLTLERGEVLAVLGPNGAGKSTLLEAVGGVIPTSSGTVTCAGRVASVLQTPGLARRSVMANVELALGWWGVPRSRRRARATEALERMRAGHLAWRRADTLSGGERRRVHVARGVALQPDLLLLDEPFAGLDPDTRAGLCDDTAAAVRGGESGVMVILHDRSEAWAMAHRIAVLTEGRLSGLGRPDELLASPPSAAVARFLGYDGVLADDDGVHLTRPPHVRIDPGGAREATVSAITRLLDGVRVELVLGDGVLHALHPDPTVRVGERVRVVVSGGVRFPHEGHDGSDPSRVAEWRST